eukprot:354533-Chlamydomonas_euryale.AAC.5
MGHGAGVPAAVLGRTERLRRARHDSRRFFLATWIFATNRGLGASAIARRTRSPLSCDEDAL